MKLSVAQFFAGLFGALAALCILLSFGTDYWLLASETCQSDSAAVKKSMKINALTGRINQRGDVVLSGEDMLNSTIYYHEGFFWKCTYDDKSKDDNHLLLKLWLTNQPQFKVCVQAYLFPFPVDPQTHNATNYESAIIYRGFWSVFMLIGVAAVVVGGFVFICAAPFASHRLYKAGGGLFLVSGVFLLAVVVMYVLWVQVLGVVDLYVDYRRATECPGFQLSHHYGPSFMLAPVGIFFAFLSGLLFLLIGRSIQIHYN